MPAMRYAGSGSGLASPFGSNDRYYEWVESVEASSKVHGIKDVAEMLGLEMAFHSSQNHRIFNLEVEVPMSVSRLSVRVAQPTGR